MSPSSLTNWAGNVAFGAARVHRPETVEEVRRIVAGAERVRVLGSGHSFNRLADTGGDLVRLRRGDADFDGCVVALGALGVVTRLTLEVVPTFEMAQTVIVDVPLDGVEQTPDDVLDAAYNVSLFTDWRARGAVWLKRRVD